MLPGTPGRGANLYTTTNGRKVFVVKRNTASYEIAGSWTLAEARALYDAEQPA